MGAVVGEKISRAIQRAIKEKLCFCDDFKICRCTNDGSSLFVNADGKNFCQSITTIRKKLPYISLLTDPTTGGVTASYAMLGDVNIAEPGALIGFAAQE